MKERNTFTIDEFLGVDFSSSPMKVNPRRATSAVNFITEYGTLKKRNGWVELQKFMNKKITGMYNYGDFMIVRAGDKIYRVNEDMTFSTLYTIEQTQDERVSFFANDGDIFIVGLGQYLMFHQTGFDTEGEPIYQIHPVRDYAYIPTTSISIDDQGSTVKNQASLEPVNLLTVKRKNSLIGRDDVNLTWMLDSPIRENDDVLTKVTVDIELFSTVSNTLVYKKYETNPSATGLERYLFDENETSFIVENAKGEVTRINKGVQTQYVWKQISFTDYNNLSTKYIYNIEGTGEVASVETVNALYPPNYDLWAFTKGSAGVRVIQDLGSVHYGLFMISGVPASGVYQKIEIYENTKPPVTGADNITVTFESATTLDATPIEQARCGVIFGVNGTTNQLFLAYKSVEHYSKAYDFTYFPDIQYNFLGNKENPILGYSRLSDSGLVIYKDNKARESRLYFRTVSLVDSIFNQYENRYLLSNKAIDANIGCDAPLSIANLSGDNLFLSKQGLWAVTLGDNISVESRHVRERSALVNKRLVTENIKNGIAIVFDNRYYLAIDNTVYVADARYRSASDMDDTFSYEFFYWVNVPVSAWLIFNDELYFGTAEGRICKFDNKYSDRTLIKASDGDVTLVVDGNYLVHNEAIEVNPNDEVYANCYELLLSPSDFTVNLEDDAVIDLIDLNMVVEDGTIVYIKNISGTSGLDDQTPYVVADYDDTSFRLKTIDGDYADIVGSNFEVWRNLSEITMYASDIDTENSRFRLKRSPTLQTVTLRSYVDEPVNFTIVIHKPVEMIWYTPIFDCGTNLMSKTLLSLTLAADGSSEGPVLFGYETRYISRNLQSINFKSFNLEDIDFNNFTFLTAIASSYTIPAKEKDFNYIILKFSSSTANNIVVNGLTVLYKINAKNKGVR